MTKRMMFDFLAAVGLGTALIFVIIYGAITIGVHGVKEINAHINAPHINAPHINVFGARIPYEEVQIGDKKFIAYKLGNQLQLVPAE